MGARAAFGAALVPRQARPPTGAARPATRCTRPPLGDANAASGADASSGPVMPPHLGKLLHALDVAPRGATPAAATLLGLRSELSTLRRRGPVAVVPRHRRRRQLRRRSLVRVARLRDQHRDQLGLHAGGPELLQRGQGARSRLRRRQRGGERGRRAAPRRGVHLRRRGWTRCRANRIVLDAMAHAGGVARQSGVPYYDVAEESVRRPQQRPPRGPLARARAVGAVRGRATERPRSRGRLSAGGARAPRSPSPG